MKSEMLEKLTKEDLIKVVANMHDIIQETSIAYIHCYPQYGLITKKGTK